MKGQPARKEPSERRLLVAHLGVGRHQARDRLVVRQMQLERLAQVDRCLRRRDDLAPVGLERALDPRVAVGAPLGGHELGWPGEHRADLPARLTAGHRYPLRRSGVEEERPVDALRAVEPRHAVERRELLRRARGDEGGRAELVARVVELLGHEGRPDRPPGQHGGGRRLAQRASVRELQGGRRVVLDDRRPARDRRAGGREQGGGGQEPRGPCEPHRPLPLLLHQALGDGADERGADREPEDGARHRAHRERDALGCERTGGVHEEPREPRRGIRERDERDAGREPDDAPAMNDQLDGLQRSARARAVAVAVVRDRLHGHADARGPPSGGREGERGQRTTADLFARLRRGLHARDLGLRRTVHEERDHHRLEAIVCDVLVTHHVLDGERLVRLQREPSPAVATQRLTPDRELDLHVTWPPPAGRRRCHRVQCRSARK